MLKTRIAAGALVSVLILSMSSSIAFAADNAMEKIDDINFKQTFIVSNNTDAPIVPDIEPFEYTIDNEVDTSFSTINGMNTVYKGDLDKVTLNTPKITFDKEIEANTTNVEVSYDINISFGEFDLVGIHRYRLVRNDDRAAYFDVYVFNDNGTPVVGGCNFYDATVFNNEKQTKIGEFIDANDNYTIRSIIRFEDQSGELLTEDIILSKPYSSPTSPKTPITLGGRGNSKISTNIFLNEVFTNLELGLDQYEQNLNTLIGENYVLIKDEVAENIALDSPVWFSNDPATTLIFHVVMQAPATFRVRIAKVDADNTKYYLKGAEFTVYREDGTIVNDINGNPCVGVTDADGYLEFVILSEKDVKFYIKETKAPKGYEINDDKFYITPTVEGASVEDAEKNIILVPVFIKDKSIVIPPRTGDTFNPVYYICLTLIGVGVTTGGIIYVRKKIKQSKNSNE